MEVLKSERIIVPIEKSTALSFAEKNIYLWVIHADKIPPHLGISLGDQFFSLKANGKDNGLSVFKILPILEKKNITTVFYEIDSSVDIIDPQDVFDSFQTTITGEITCLEPLKAIFGNTNATWLKELLSNLEDSGVIRGAYGWQLPVGFEGIPNYNPRDIHNRLRALDNV